MASNAASLYRAKGLKGRYSKIFKEENASTIDNDTNRNYALSKRRKMVSTAMTWENFNNGLKISLKKAVVLTKKNKNWLYDNRLELMPDNIQGIQSDPVRSNQTQKVRSHTP